MNLKNVTVIMILISIGMVSLNARIVAGEPAEASAVVESPCTDCLENARNAYAICSANASTTAAENACTKTLQNAVVQCNAGPCKH